MSPSRETPRFQLLNKALATITLSIAAATAIAQNGPPRTRPPESLAACAALQSGAACTFSGPRGAVKGVCIAPAGKALACIPVGMPPPSGNLPPIAK